MFNIENLDSISCHRMTFFYIYSYFELCIYIYNLWRTFVVLSLLTHCTIFPHMLSLLQGRREMFYLTTQSTHFIYGYMASYHSDSERGNPLPPHGLLFPISLCYTSRGALPGTRNSSMGRPTWRIDPTTHRTMSERSYHRATSRSGLKETPTLFVYVGSKCSLAVT